MVKIKGQKDFWSGVIYVSFGAAVLLASQHFPMGRAGRMGPAYFPTMLSSLLILIGVIAVARSFIKSGGRIDAVAWKPLVLIVAGTVGFGFLVLTMGLVVALATLALVSAAASTNFKLGWRPLVGLAAVIALCVLVFVYGLGVPMPAFGPWLEPLLGSRIAG